MIRYISERQQTVPNRQMSWLRVGLFVVLGVAFVVALLVANMPALLALQHNAFALLTAYLNHLPTGVFSYHPTMPSCGGILLPC